MRKQFTLFNSTQKRSESPSHAKLTGLKALTREYIELHNQMVHTVWDLKLLIAEQGEHPEETQRLVTALQQLENKLTEADSERKINDLLHEIRDIEIELTGSSKISNSPYEL